MGRSDVGQNRTVAPRRRGLQTFSHSLVGDGNNSVLTVPNVGGALDVFNNTSMTIAFWAKLDAPDTSGFYYSGAISSSRKGVLIRYRTDGFNNGVNVYVNDGAVSAHIYSWNMKGYGYYKTLGEWHLYVFVFDRTNSLLSFYFDNVLQSESTYSGSLAGVPNDWGTAGDDLHFMQQLSAGGAISGKFAAAWAWSKALSQTEWEDLWYEKIATRSSLEVEFLLTEGSGNPADTSGNGNDGTLSLTTWSTDIPATNRSVIGANRTSVS